MLDAGFGMDFVGCVARKYINHEFVISISLFRRWNDDSFLDEMGEAALEHEMNMTC